MFIDVHAHMDHELMLNDIDNILTDCKNKNVIAIVSNGTSPNSNRTVLQLSKNHDLIKPALGLYPIEANPNEGLEEKREFIEFYDKDYNGKAHELSAKKINELFDLNYKYYIEKEIEFIKSFKKDIIAIGEVGIDLHWTKELKYQEYAFIKIIELANELNKTLLVHARDAEGKAFDLLKKHNAKKVVMHCFGGSIDLAKEIAKYGYSFSIPASIGRNKKTQKLVQALPIDKILTETDSPYLAPINNQTNYPYNVKDTVNWIASLKGLTFGETKNIIYMNYQKLFL